MLTLFHGSDKIIERPYYGAREWSVDENRDGFLNCYELDLYNLRVLRLCEGYSILHWLAILLENRKFQITSKLAREARRYLLKHFSVPYKDSDILIGYRADDSYFAFANDFLNGTISLRQLEEAMYLGKLGEQVVLKSEESYRHISFLKYEPVDAAVWYPRRKERDQRARQRYFDQDRDGWQRGELYMPKILDEEIGPNDTRIQRIIY